MKYYEREFFISRLEAGYIRYKTTSDVLKIYYPNNDILYEANELYIEIYEDSLELALSEDEVLQILTKNGKWNNKIEEDFNQMPKSLENLKIELYNNRFKSNTCKQIRKYILEVKKEFERLAEIKNSLSQYTASGIAHLAKCKFLIEQCTMTSNNTLYNWTDVGINEVMNHYYGTLIDDSNIREVSRTEPWITQWAVKKISNKTFDVNMTNEHKQLIVYSKMYDSISECHEPPTYDVIEDDDMLDGWLLLRRKENKKETHGIESITQNKKILNSDEIMVPVETDVDAEKIGNWNDLEADIIRKRRLKYLQNKGEARIDQMPDMQDRIRMEAVQAYRNKIHGK